MSGVHIFPNAHGTAVSGSTFYVADTVSTWNYHIPARQADCMVDAHPDHQWRQDGI